MFKPSNALLVETLAKICGARVVLPVVQEVVLALLEELEGAPPGPEVQGRWCVVAEVLTGVVSSGAAFCIDGTSGATNAWDAWVRAAVARGIKGAPLDLAGIWSVWARLVCLRLAWGPAAAGLQDPGALQQVLDFLLEFLQQTRGQTGPEPVKALRSCLGVLEELGRHPGLEPRSMDLFLRFASSSAREMMALRSNGSPQVRTHSSRAMAGLLPLLPSLCVDPDNMLMREVMEMRREAERALLTDLSEGSAAVVLASHSIPEDNPGDRPAMDPDLVARLLFSIYFLNALMRGHTTVDSLPLLLESILPVSALHESPVPELQTVTDAARACMRRFKYLPLQGELLGRMQQVILSTAGAPQYWVRAFGLVLGQTWWFRQALLLSPADLQPVLQRVLESLEDKKQEVGRLMLCSWVPLSGPTCVSPTAQVRELASGTLSGMLRGLDGPSFRQLLGDFRLRVKRQSASQESLAALHGAVLGLSAFVTMSPYSVPPWLPPALMVLLDASGPRCPQLIRGAIAKILGRFRQTHDREELRTHFSEDEWSALISISSPATYIT